MTLTVSRMKDDLAAADLVQSAVAEATHSFMQAVNRPGCEVFRALRTGGLGQLFFRPTLARTGTLASRMRGVESIQAQLAVTDRDPLPTAHEGQPEWRGRLSVVARLVRRGEATVVAAATRELRAASTAPPPPLDRYGFYDWRTPNPGQIRGPFELDRAYYEHKAALRIAPDPSGDVSRRLSVLARRLGALGGIVWVDNRAGAPLVLRRWDHRGRTLLVVSGAVELEDVRLADPRTDVLTCLAFGDVRLAGTVEACVILTHAPGDPPGSRWVAPGTEIRGAYLLTWGGCDAPEGLRLTWRPETLVSSQGPSQAVLPDRIHVSVSPTLLAGKVVFE